MQVAQHSVVRTRDEATLDKEKSQRYKPCENHYDKQPWTSQITEKRRTSGWVPTVVLGTEATSTLARGRLNNAAELAEHVKVIIRMHTRKLEASWAVDIEVDSGSSRF